VHPEEGDFTLSLPLQGSTALHKAEFDAAQARSRSRWPSPAPSRSTAARC
jgi:hypothetical protein